MSSIFDKINQLPQHVEDLIWSFNVECHQERMKNVLQELNEKQSCYCMRCHDHFYIKDLIDKNQMASFSAEYFFKTYDMCYSYGVICCKPDCVGRTNTKRFDEISYERHNYYSRRARRLGLYKENMDTDEDEENE